MREHARSTIYGKDSLDVHRHAISGVCFRVKPKGPWVPLTDEAAAILGAMLVSDSSMKASPVEEKTLPVGSQACGVDSKGPKPARASVAENQGSPASSGSLPKATLSNEQYGPFACQIHEGTCWACSVCGMHARNKTSVSAYIIHAKGCHRKA